MKIEKELTKRVSVILFFLYLWIAFVCVTLIKIQIFDYDKFKKKIEAQRSRTVSFHPKRGTIFDSKGRILAISIETNSAYINNKTGDPGNGIRVLEKARRIINIPRKKQNNIRKYLKRGDSFVWLKRKLPDYEYEKLKKLRLENKSNGIKCNIEFIQKDEYKRIYPKGVLLAQVLGGVGIDEQGLAGFEFSRDKKIKGKGGKKQIMMDAKKRAFKNKYLEEPVFGKDYHLTIDSTVQYIVENELKKGIQENNARSATAIVMESKTGNVIAMANFPEFDPASISNTSLNTIKNKAVSYVYEPGSTFKVILAAIALKNNVTYPQERVYCGNGSFELKDRFIRDHTPYENLTFEDIIVYSSNIGAAKIGLRFKREAFYKEIKRFGFGVRPKIQLPGNERGILRNQKEWSDVSIGFISHGYEIATTPIQLLKAVNVIASKGYLINPNIIKSPSLERNDKVEKIISAPVCNRIIAIMKKVVSTGTGKKAALDGIKIAGKTGTAKKNINGRYVKKYIASFVGFFPADDPIISMIVLYDEPKGKYYGGDVAAPVFKKISEKLIIYKNILPSIKQRKIVKI